MTEIRDLTAEEYHADPCEKPSLSASLAHLFCTTSPRHVWTAHPRLNPDWKPHFDGKFDLGTAVHAIILEGRDVIHPVAADDWRTEAAKYERDTARANGKVPLLRTQLGDVEAMVAAVNAQLLAHRALPQPFTGGRPEQMICWQQDGAECRALIDWLHDDYLHIDDLKTTTRSASPDAFSRNLFSLGYDVKAAWYIQAVEAVTGVTPTFRWVVAESYPPFALSVIEPGPDVLTIGMKKVLYARALWRRCLKSDDWPAYGSDVARAVLPPWEETRWLEKELREEMAT